MGQSSIAETPSNQRHTDVKSVSRYRSNVTASKNARRKAIYLVGLKKLLIFGMIGLAGCAGASATPQAQQAAASNDYLTGGCISVCG